MQSVLYVLNPSEGPDFVSVYIDDVLGLFFGDIFTCNGRTQS